LTAGELFRERIDVSLGKLAGTNPQPTSDEMTAVFLSAGARDGDLEVSNSTTPTGLAANAIEAAARVGNECVFGQVRAGAVATAVLPVMATGSCFIGDQR
jgi:hypothetical protein